MSNMCVFLTRGELQIQGDDTLTVHLKLDDKRLKDISNLLNKEKLKIVTINPKKFPSMNKSFFEGNWYLIPTLKYIGCSDYSGYTHFTFKYRLYKDYMWDKDGVRLLSSDEINKFRKTLSLS